MQTVEEGEQWMVAIRWVSLNYAHSRCFDLFFNKVCGCNLGTMTKKN